MKNQKSHNDVTDRIFKKMKKCIYLLKRYVKKYKKQMVYVRIIFRVFFLICAVRQKWPLKKFQCNRFRCGLP